MANEIDALLARVDDPALRRDLKSQFDRLRQKRQFGLVFEEHLPERVVLPQHPIRRGTKVVPRDDHDADPRVVASVVSGTATLPVEGDGNEDVPVDSLIAIAEFGEAIYPGLKRLGSVERGGDKPAHVVIKGENHHALEALQFTHAGKVDCIYIDPPYNLGGDLTYNDKRVAREDAFRHSKWLAYMDRRLRLAKELLTPTGAIIVAIDDTELAHLRLLMDQIFSENSHIATVVWQGGRKNDARFVSVGHDYMLIYASKEALQAAGIRWREPKAGAAEALSRAREIWREHGDDVDTANSVWSSWLKSQKQDGASTDAVNRYDQLDPSSGRPRHTYGDLSWPGGGGGDYDILHPETGLPVKRSIRGWLFRDPERMQQEIESGRVYFGADERTIPRGIRFLDEMEDQVATSVFELDRKAVNAQLKRILGEDRFRYPKDPRVLGRWISLVTARNPEATVLDFFAGSASTVHAVMDLNRRDGSRRRCIAVTNNEIDERTAVRLAKDGHRPGDPEWEKWGIYDYVAKPRVEAVVTGVTPQGARHSEPRDENVEFVELTYLDAEEVELDMAFTSIAPLLWMRAGSRGPIIEQRTIDGEPLPFASTDVYGILFDPDEWRSFLDVLSDTVSTVFVVTDSASVFAGVAAELPDGLDVVRLYENYLTTFAIDQGGRR